MISTEATHIAIDMHDGTAFVQRLEPSTASDPPMSPYERAILLLYRERDEASRVARSLFRLYGVVRPEYAATLCAAHPWLKEADHA